MVTTTEDVRDALENLNTAEIRDSDLAGGVSVALSAEEAGQFFKQIRIRGFDAQSKRIGDTLVSHIEAEEEEEDEKSLTDLFG